MRYSAERDPFVMFVAWCCLAALVITIWAVLGCEWRIAAAKVAEIQQVRP